MIETAKAKLRPTTHYSWLWLIPVLTLALVAVIVWRNLPEDGELLTLYFDDVSGLKPIQTKLQYLGLEVGQVEELELTLDKKGVKATLHVDAHIVPMLREKSRFWLVKPEIGSGGITGINTLVSGPYITFSPGEGEPHRKFVAAQSPPLEKPEELKFRIKSGLKNNISPGDSLYYKQVEVGSVYAYELQSDHVMFYAQIKPDYQALLRSNSVFWENSGLEFDMGLTGLSVSAAPLMSLLSGGISFATPTEFAEEAQVDSEFHLFEDQKEDWPNWQPKIKLPKSTIGSNTQDTPEALPETLKQGVGATVKD